MKFSQEMMDKAGVKPKLVLFKKDERGVPKPTGPHTVTVIEDKLFKGTDRESGEEVYKMKYFFKDSAGNEYEYSCPLYDKYGELHYFVRKMSAVPEGTEVILEGKKGATGSYIDILWEGANSVDAEEIDY